MKALAVVLRVVLELLEAHHDAAQQPLVVQTARLRVTEHLFGTFQSLKLFVARLLCVILVLVRMQL